MHAMPGAANTPEALSYIISDLKNGYDFVTISDLIVYRIRIVQGIMQGNKADTTTSIIRMVTAMGIMKDIWKDTTPVIMTATWMDTMVDIPTVTTTAMMMAG